VRDVEVRYAIRDNKRLAYEVFGGGSCDIALFQSVCPIDLMWDLPQLASFLDAVGALGRVIAFDIRGQGASDPIPDFGAATIETFADDLLAVLEAAGSDQATILDLNHGIVSAVFAATYPHRVRSLIVPHLRTSFPELHGSSAEVFFTDIVASTQQLAAVGDEVWRRTLDDYEDTVDRAVAAHRGRVIKKMGDGALATFDGPARAVHCAEAIRMAVAEDGVVVRSGLHTGEIEMRGSDVAGIAVHIASRVAALAQPGEILVSRTVVDLTAGSGIDFDSRGDHALKGVPGNWRLFAVN
jgi:pimeloyl-ACP methyl ester carboxylesterase